MAAAKKAAAKPSEDVVTKTSDVEVDDKKVDDKTVTVTSPTGIKSQVPLSILDALIESGYTK